MCAPQFSVEVRSRELDALAVCLVRGLGELRRLHCDGGGPLDLP